MIRVAIIGATGYTAIESIKILLRHPQVQITMLTSRGQHCHINEIFPALRDRLDLMVEPLDFDKLGQVADVAFCCLPHKASMEAVPLMLQAGVKVVDFSADYRLHDAKLYEETYKVAHSDSANIAQAAFGLPELFRDKIKGASLVANPGCYPTAASLGLAPLLENKIIACDDIIVNAVSGTSGVGRKESLAWHFPEMNENYFGYGIGNHRHMPEMQQILSEKTGQKVKLLFQPHVISIDRGIVETIYCQPLTKMTDDKLLDLFKNYYKNEPFVRIFNKPPTMKDVSHTNFCDIFVANAKGRIVVFSAIDNLIKGAAGQAVQNMNIICGIEETMAL